MTQPTPFSNMLIANRDDNRNAAQVAAKVHVGAADMSRRQIALRAKRAAIAPRH